MRFPRNISAAQARCAKIGDVFILDGHRPGCGSTLFRSGFKFTTNMGFLVFKPSMPVVKVTAVEVTEMPET